MGNLKLITYRVFLAVTHAKTINYKKKKTIDLVIITKCIYLKHE